MKRKENECMGWKAYQETEKKGKRKEKKRQVNETKKTRIGK